MSETGAARPARPGAAALIERLEAHEATVGVVGLGYVGLPVALAFGEVGFRVIGVDTDRKRIGAIEAGESYLTDVSAEKIAEERRSGRLRVTISYRPLRKADVVLICVPTPLLDGIPDLSAIEGAARALGGVIAPGTLVVLESTTYPGTTEEILMPLLEAGGAARGRDFFLAYSPERIDPGNPHFGFRDIPKVVGGVDPESARAAEVLYSQVVPKVMTVSGTREAEMAKLIENTFRHVNIALVNELGLYARELGVDIWEAIEAASTKPFGFMPFWPGPGWGGHCIPLDPSFLSWRVRQHRAHDVQFIELAHRINAQMPVHVVERITRLLNDRGKALRGSRILGIGVAFKGGTEDTRESAGLKVLEALSALGASVAYHDPLVAEVEIGEKRLRSVPLTPKTVGDQDLVVTLVPQSGVDWDVVYRDARSILDCCNVFARRDGKVVRL